ncbi:MAG: glycosyltransferase family 2 protein [Bacteroidales bacterium]|nr:glycosyltransferase family 2 protein [Bacteroidales bacterium]
MESPELSIIIVNYNVKFLLQQCLFSVQAATKTLSHEIFVVDNCSSDGSVDYLRPLFPDVIFIENKNNPGFSKANNQAIALARGKYVLLLNPDTVVGENVLDNICRFMDNHPDVGGVGVKMIDGSGRFLPESKRSFPSPWNSFCKMFGLSFFFPNSSVFAKYQLKYLSADQSHKVEVLSGAFMLLRHTVLEKIGVLDERFFMYGEDIDLSYRIILGGYVNYYLPERIIHYKGESTHTNDIAYVKTFYHAMLLFYRKYYPRSGFIVSSIIRFAIYLRGSLTAFFKMLGCRKRRKKNEKSGLMIIAGEECQESVREKSCSCLGTSDLVIVCKSTDEAEKKIAAENFRISEVSDIVLCSDDFTFSQIIAFMDVYPDKNITFHLYNRKYDLFISPKE